jgi:hypothetical protein
MNMQAEDNTRSAEESVYVNIAEQKEYYKVLEEVCEHGRQKKLV